jgi:hypothetical protein
MADPPGPATFADIPLTNERSRRPVPDPLTCEPGLRAGSPPAEARGLVASHSPPAPEMMSGKAQMGARSRERPDRSHRRELKRAVAALVCSVGTSFQTADRFYVWRHAPRGRRALGVFQEGNVRAALPDAGQEGGNRRLAWASRVLNPQEEETDWGLSRYRRRASKVLRDSYNRASAVGDLRRTE